MKLYIDKVVRLTPTIQWTRPRNSPSSYLAYAKAQSWCSSAPLRNLIEWSAPRRKLLPHSSICSYLEPMVSPT